MTLPQQHDDFGYGAFMFQTGQHFMGVEGT